MKVTRWLQIRLLRLLNQTLPPFVRDARWLMALPMRLVFREHAEVVMNFKIDAYAMTNDEFRAVYEQIRSCALAEETDLNDACQTRILADAVGDTVLEVGCGAGALAKALGRRHTVTACDIVVDDDLVSTTPEISFREANVEDLPFQDREFDTVVCTHTLEHVRDLQAAIGELRRVARERLVVVVPMERPYRFTFNLHLHFFPYPHSLRAVMGARPRSHCLVLGGDLYYLEMIGEDGSDRDLTRARRSRSIQGASLR
ncbi:MAG: class I SAM-dependent methyltransferase [Acidimicrobiia bacterium]